MTLQPFRGPLRCGEHFPEPAVPSGGRAGGKNACANYRIPVSNYVECVGKHCMRPKEEVAKTVD